MKTHAAFSGFTKCGIWLAQSKRMKYVYNLTPKRCKLVTCKTCLKSIKE